MKRLLAAAFAFICFNGFAAEGSITKSVKPLGSSSAGTG